MDPVSLLVAGVSSFVGLGIGVLVGRSTATPEEEAPPALVTDSRELRRLRERALAYEAELRDERARAERLAALGGGAPTPPATGRPSRAVLQAFATRLLELGPVRGTLVATCDGLPATRGDDPLCQSLGALAPALDHDGLREVRLVTETGAHLTLRRLPAWTEGAWLVARGQSGFVNPVALDLVCGEPVAEGPRAVGGDRGQEGGPSAEVLADMLGGTRAVTLARIVGDRVVARASDEGLDGAETLAASLVARDLLRRATHGARQAIATCALGYADGRWVAVAPVTGADDLVVAITRDEPLDELAARRLQGALRRVPSEGEMGAIAS